MIEGSGLLANACRSRFAACDDVMVYAAGVSNSACTDLRDFQREASRLELALRAAWPMRAFVYFGTCSVDDPEMVGSLYVRHKIAMESLVRGHPGHLILRLPQVAGHTPNPHTLLNFLYACIVRGERFKLFTRATRNIVDVDDVVRVMTYLIDHHASTGLTLSIGNLGCSAVSDLVVIFERLTGKQAVMDRVDRGGSYPVDLSAIRALMPRYDEGFSDGYVERVIKKYYG